MSFLASVTPHRRSRGATFYGAGSLLGLAFAIALWLAVGDWDYLVGLFLVLFGTTLLMELLGFIAPRVRPFLFCSG